LADFCSAVSEKKIFEISAYQSILLALAAMLNIRSLGGPLSKLCVAPPFSINFRCQIENQVSDYRLLAVIQALHFVDYKDVLRFKDHFNSNF
jgi:hypothetical protein